jgi:hypothetical protein
LGYVTGTEEIVTKQDKILKILKGVYNRGDPPLSIPNREVKPLSADGTALWWESRLAPNFERRCLKRMPSFFVMLPVYYPFLFLKHLWSSLLSLLEK